MSHIIPHFFTGRITDCCCNCGEKMNCQFAMSMEEIAGCSDVKRFGVKISMCFEEYMRFLKKEGWEYEDKGNQLYCPVCLPSAKFKRLLERGAQKEKELATKHFEHRHCPRCHLDRNHVREQIRKAKETRDIFGKEKTK